MFIVTSLFQYLRKFSWNILNKQHIFNAKVIFYKFISTVQLIIKNNNKCFKTPEAFFNCTIDIKRFKQYALYKKMAMNTKIT